MEENNNMPSSGSSWTPSSHSSETDKSANAPSSRIPNEQADLNDESPSAQGRSMSAGHTGQVPPTPPISPYPPFSNAPDPEPSDVGQSAPAQTVVATPVEYSEGCVGAAWNDLKKTGWVKKSALMALIEYVPILNWVNSGYALRWARQLIFGKIQGLPDSIFGERTFVTGAMAFLIDFLIGIVAWFVTAVFGIVPILGIAISLCAVFFLNIINIVMNMRCAIFDALGEGFALSKVWQPIGKKFGQAFCIMFLPQLICGLIAFVIAMTIIVINGIFAGTDIALLVSNLIGYAKYGTVTDAYVMQTLAYLARTFVIMLPGIILAVFFVNWANMVGTLITYRAAGHFVARYAQEWRCEPAFVEVENKERMGNHAL